MELKTRGKPYRNVAWLIEYLSTKQPFLPRCFAHPTSTERIVEPPAGCSDAVQLPTVQAYNYIRRIRAGLHSYVFSVHSLSPRGTREHLSIYDQTTPPFTLARKPTPAAVGAHFISLLKHGDTTIGIAERFSLEEIWLRNYRSANRRYLSLTEAVKDTFKRVLSTFASVRGYRKSPINAEIAISLAVGDRANLIVNGGYSI